MPGLEHHRFRAKAPPGISLPLSVHSVVALSASMPDCGVCGRAFATSHGLIAHTEASHGGRGAVHRGVRMWEDARQQAGELTTGKSAGNYAYEVDSDDYDPDYDEWTCSICFRGFNTRRALEQHLNSGVHEESLYQCQGCAKTFKSLASLNQHVSMTGCSMRSARQVRTLLADANDAQGMLMLTDRSQVRTTTTWEGTLYFDGGATPNPGWGGGGYVLTDDRGDQIDEEAIEIKPNGTTNNQAEYIGLIYGLKEAKRQGMKRIVIKGDSELIIKQMQGVYNCNSQSIRPLYDYAVNLAQHFSSIKYEWIPRKENRQADGLATAGIRGQGEEHRTVNLRPYSTTTRRSPRP